MVNPRAVLPALALVVAGLAGCASSGTPRTATSPPPRQTTGAPGTTHRPFTMPDEVGKVLQDAQDDIQRVSGDPVFYSSSTDATGRGRHQILDRDWKVCAQNVPAGKVIDLNSEISFSVVKLAERCP